MTAPGFTGSPSTTGVRTVAGTLTEAISTVVRQPVTLTGAGRTDAGVHAWGQVISVDLPDGTDLDDLARRLNKLCAPAIAVRSVELGRRRLRRPLLGAAGGTIATTSGTRRIRIRCSPHRAWHVAAPARRRRDDGRRAARCVGEHDFSSFCRRPKVATTGDAGSRLARAWQRARRRLEPVRRSDVAMAGCCASRSGPMPSATRWSARSSARSSTSAPASCRRTTSRRSSPPATVGAAGQVAPPHGLTLWEVGY